MSATPTVRISRSRQLLWSAVFLLLLLAGLVGLARFLFSADWLKTAGTLPVAMHSALRADYSTDLHGLQQISFNLQLVEEAMRDQQASAEDARPALEALLQNPVPSITPYLVAGAIGQASPTAQPSTQASATATRNPTRSPTPSATRRTATPSATPTSIPPTRIPPTDTRQPPRATQLPATPTDSPSKPQPTRVPPTQAPPTQPPPTQPPATQAPPSYPAPPPSQPTPNPYP